MKKGQGRNNTCWHTSAFHVLRRITTLEYRHFSRKTNTTEYKEMCSIICIRHVKMAIHIANYYFYRSGSQIFVDFKNYTLQYTQQRNKEQNQKSYFE